MPRETIEPSRFVAYGAPRVATGDQCVERWTVETGVGATVPVSLLVRRQPSLNQIAGLSPAEW